MALPDGNSLLEMRLASPNPAEQLQLGDLLQLVALQLGHGDPVSNSRLLPCKKIYIYLTMQLNKGLVAYKLLRNIFL